LAETSASAVDTNPTADRIKSPEKESMPKLIAVYGSPRRDGNTAILLNKAVEGARSGGAAVEEIVLRDLKLSPCLEIYGCKQTGECVIKDDFARLREAVLSSDGMMLASPIFFYTVSSHVKIFMDRCQSLWVKKHWIDNIPQGLIQEPKRKGLFISVGATRGKKLFDGALLSIRYFFEVLDMELWKALLFRGLDFKEDIYKYPLYMADAFEAGRGLAEALRQDAAESPDQ
jgi:multimeric flavodoxin WrbA